MFRVRENQIRSIWTRTSGPGPASSEEDLLGSDPSGPEPASSDWNCWVHTESKWNQQEFCWIQTGPATIKGQFLMSFYKNPPGSESWFSSEESKVQGRVQDTDPPLSLLSISAQISAGLSGRAAPLTRVVKPQEVLTSVNQQSFICQKRTESRSFLN